MFISYSHDSEPHREWVLRFATDLRTNGIDATLDRWDLELGQDVVAFMQAGIAEADRVFLVCTDEYVQRAEAGAGGVGFERLIVTAELVQNIDTRKFIPIIRQNSAKRVPAFLGPRLYLDFSDDAEYTRKLEEVLRELHGAPTSSKPPLGVSPFSGFAPPPVPARRAGPSGLTDAGTRLLDALWFEEHAEAAIDGLRSLDLSGAMELRFGLHDPVGKSQVELLNAVRMAQIKTFGWPIGILLDGRDEFRARPTNDGIRTEVAIAERALSGDKTYDYWAASTSGDFYLLQSLFEDQRSRAKIFFNTRMVRVAEAIMFAARFYRRLGLPDETRVSLRISHLGLKGRELGSSSPARDIDPVITAEDMSQTEFIEHVGSLEPELSRHVQQVLSPLFMLFNFTEFGTEVYDDIVSRFVRGDVS
ncbi:MAG: toll/interleukin-1 receptor domain-containing protein [Gemmatimonadota bacterium]|nr:toll/interleukin-1 receptor domain-containing protein [Gemmatimonadota bacterium]